MLPNTEDIIRVLDKMVAYGWIEKYAATDDLAKIQWTLSGRNTLTKLLKPMLFENGLDLQPGDEAAFMMILDEYGRDASSSSETDAPPHPRF